MTEFFFNCRGQRKKVNGDGFVYSPSGEKRGVTISPKLSILIISNFTLSHAFLFLLCLFKKGVKELWDSLIYRNTTLFKNAR